MKVGLIQFDGKLPNLVLMKLSSYHKSLGDEVFLRSIPLDLDKLYISCIYSWNAKQAKGISLLFPNTETIIGGYGVSGVKLPSEVEHMYPDYDLFGVDYAMGYTSRGCIRNCEFCVVPKYEGKIHEVAWFDEFVKDQEKIVLLDPNFVASPKFRTKAEWLISKGKKVNISQGIDIRLMNKERSKILSKVNCYNVKFSRKTYYIAFDNSNIEKSFRKGIENMISSGIKPYKIMVYFLCGFKSSFSDDMKRFNIINSYGADPYVMLYNKYENDYNVRKHFQRWVNGRIYKSCEWDDYIGGKNV